MLQRFAETADGQRRAEQVLMSLLQRPEDLQRSLQRRFGEDPYALLGRVAEEIGIAVGQNQVH